MSKRVTIITVTYNSAALLERWVASVAVQDVTDFDVIIVDNASTESQRPKPESIPQTWRLIQNESNLGFAEANNRAVAEAKTPFVAFLNPDAFPNPDWLKELLATALARPHVAAFGSTQLMDSDPAKLDGAGDVWHIAGIPFRGGFERIAPLPYPDGECFTPCAAAALWRREAFLDLGGFEGRYFAYCEDVDLGFRLRLAGGTAWQVGAAVVRHIGSGITGRRSEFSVRLGTRNRLWTYVRCMPGLLFWVMLPVHVVATAILWFKAYRDGAGSAYWAGLHEGMSRLEEFWADRVSIQKLRRATVHSVASKMAWNPITLLTRRTMLKQPD